MCEITSFLKVHTLQFSCILSLPYIAISIIVFISTLYRHAYPRLLWLYYIRLLLVFLILFLRLCVIWTTAVAVQVVIKFWQPHLRLRLWLSEIYYLYLFRLSLYQIMRFVVWFSHIQISVNLNYILKWKTISYF